MSPQFYVNIRIGCRSRGKVARTAYFGGGIALIKILLYYPLVMTNIAMENCPFLEMFVWSFPPWKMVILQLATLNNQRVNMYSDAIISIVEDWVSTWDSCWIPKCWNMLEPQWLALPHLRLFHSHVFWLNHIKTQLYWSFLYRYQLVMSVTSQRTEIPRALRGPIKFWMKRGRRWYYWRRVAKWPGHWHKRCKNDRGGLQLPRARHRACLAMLRLHPKSSIHTIYNTIYIRMFPPL